MKINRTKGLIQRHNDKINAEFPVLSILTILGNLQESEGKKSEGHSSDSEINNVFNYFH